MISSKFCKMFGELELLKIFKIFDFWNRLKIILRFQALATDGVT